MKIYNKKSDILVDLGKDKKDIRYLERAVERGEVVEVSGYYIKKDELLGEAFKILWIENKRLQEEIEKISENSQEVEELKVNVDYYKQEAEEANDKVVALESVLDNLRAKGLDI
jgi:predicted transcriptional regulator